MAQLGTATKAGAEKDARWYSERFLANEQNFGHYTTNRYYYLFTAMALRLSPEHNESILEIGCGSGHLAGLLSDIGVAGYCGFDFSEARVEFAQKTYPDCEFHVADIFATDLFETVDYDTVICTEVLEHIERDRDVLSKIKPGTRFLGSVPNYDSAAHVRYFASAAEIETRYRDLFSQLRIDALPHNPKGGRIFVIDGIIA